MNFFLMEPVHGDRRRLQVSFVSEHPRQQSAVHALNAVALHANAVYFLQFVLSCSERLQVYWLDSRWWSGQFYVNNSQRADENTATHQYTVTCHWHVMAHFYIIQEKEQHEDALLYIWTTVISYLVK